LREDWSDFCLWYSRRSTRKSGVQKERQKTAWFLERQSQPIKDKEGDLQVVPIISNPDLNNRLRTEGFEKFSKNFRIARRLSKSAQL